MKIFTDGLYNAVDNLYLERDNLNRTVDELERKQSEIFNNIEKYDEYMMYRDMQNEVESIIEYIEELEYQSGDIELMDAGFKEYTKMNIDELKEEAESYGLSKDGDRLDIVQRLIAKIYN